MVRIYQHPGGNGVALEIDGFIVPELTHLTVECPVDDVVQVKANVLGTTPFTLEVDRARVEIVHRTPMDFVTLAQMCREHTARKRDDVNAFLEALAREFEQAEARVPR